MEFTPEQSRAIGTECRNILVSAAAGSGKTRVLVERIIRKIADPDSDVGIDRLLVVTFTNAAAAEMNERIRKALTQLIAAGGAHPKLLRQMDLINNATITTIHSFCLEVIRNNFHVLDIDPGFRVADEAETAMVRSEAMSELFEEIYDADPVDPVFAELAEWYGGGNDDELLQKVLLGIYSEIQSHPYPLEWLKRHTDAFSAPAGTLEKSLIEAVGAELTECAADLADALAMAAAEPLLSGYATCITAELAAVKEAISKLEAVGAGARWDDVPDILGGIKFDALKGGRGVDDSLRAPVKALRDRAKDRIAATASDYAVFRSAGIERDRAALSAVFGCVAGLLTGFDAIFGRLKRERGIMDFNDIEHYCLEILTGEDGRNAGVADAYRARYKEIMVDEYQDTNFTQEAIFKAIDQNTFMVGDMKQSIYRFRNANPDIFAAKYDAFDGDEASEAPDRKILLNINFRSSPEIIDAVNHVFGRLMSRRAGELDYTVDEALYFGATQIAPGVPVELSILESESINEDQEESEAAAAIEAAYIAGQILTLRKEAPELRFKDMMVLMRSSSGLTDIYRKKFEEAGIPAYIDSNSGLFDSLEVRNMMSLLQIIDNPRQDIPLLAVLRSPIGGFTASEIAAMKTASGLKAGENYIDGLARLTDGDGRLGERAAAFMQKLEAWRLLAARLPTHELIWELYRQTFYYDYAGALPNGGRRQANLKLLYEKAAEFEKTAFKGLFNFNTFIARLEMGKGDMGPAVVLSENDDVVRVMSIHKSKGLEFKAVFLAGCGRKFNTKDLNEKILIHRDLGFGPEVYDAARRLRYSSAHRNIIRRRLRSEMMSEELRILYVGMTRAKERLYISGVYKNLKGPSARWSEKPTPGRVLSASCMLDWVCAAFYDHPDASALHGCTPADQAVQASPDGAAKLRVNIIRDSGFMQPSEDATDTVFKLPEPAQAAAAGSDAYRDIVARLDWKYPFEAASTLPSKITVSEYNKRYGGDDSRDDVSPFKGVRPLQVVPAPAFLSDGATAANAAQVGTLTHNILQIIPLSPECGQPEHVRHFIDSQAEKGMMTPEEAAAVDAGQIAAFFRSEHGRRMLSAKRVWRELAFNLAVPADELLSAPSGEKILVQGVIDCYYVDAQGSVLLDYKTDSISGFSADSVRQAYGSQIGLYRRALTLRFGSPPDQCGIFMLKNGEFVDFNYPEDSPDGKNMA